MIDLGFKKAALLLAAAVMLPLSGTEFRAEVRSEGGGRGLNVRCDGKNLLIGSAGFFLDKNNVGIAQKEKGYRENRAKSADGRTMTAQDKLVKLTTRYTLTDDSLRADFEYEVRPHPEGERYQLVVEIDPAQFSAVPPHMDPVRSAEHGSKLRLPTPGCTYLFDFTGSPHSCKWEDFRHAAWSKRMRLQFEIPYDKVNGIKGKCHFVLRVLPPPTALFQTISLEQYGNRPLIDEVANDKKGGWTDQGSNDLHALKQGTLWSASVPFEIGSKAIVLKSQNRDYFPLKSPVIPLNGLRAERLAFCHTVAWGEKQNLIVFEYLVTYEDGSQVTVPVRYGQQVMDWWGGAEAPAARIAWQGQNNENAVVLHHSQWINPAPQKKLKSIQVISRNTQCVPGIVAITAVKEGVMNPQGGRLTELDQKFAERVKKNVDVSRWFPCPLDWQGKIQSGTAIDVSSLNHKPAGKYGFVKVNASGAFEFTGRPGEAIRFWGTNAALSGPIPPKELAPGIARSLAAQGVNMLRLHLWSHQQKFEQENIITPSGTVNTDAQDRMEFFVSELKKNGIYIYMDWNDGLMWNRLVPGIKDANWWQVHAAYKFYSLFEPALIEGTKKLAQHIFLHRNPYTGLTMVEDPAFAVFEISNENSVHSVPTGRQFDKNYPLYRQLDERYRAFRREKGWDPSVKLSLRPTYQQTPEEAEFFARIGKKYYEEMRHYLHSIGVKVPVCGTNWSLCTADTWESTGMDLTGTHSYNTAPRNARRPGPAGSSLANSTQLSLPFFQNLVRGRVEKMPMIISEWQFEYPIYTRCEALPFMTAVASLNNWEGLIIYCATGSNNWGRWQTFAEDPVITTHTQHTDPATWGLTQVMAVAYRNGYIAPAKNKITFTLTTKDAFANRYPAKEFPFLCTMTGVTNRFVKEGEAQTWPLDRKYSANEVMQEALKRLNLTASAHCLPSDTGELRRCFEPGLFIVDAPKCQMATGALHSMKKGERGLRDFEVVTSVRFGTLALVSLDGKDLKTSGRILACLVGDARNRGAKFDGEKHLEWGKGPVVAEPLSAELACRTVAGKKVTVYPLDTLTGARKKALAVQMKGGKERFRLDNGSAKTIYFEIVRQ